MDKEIVKIYVDLDGVLANWDKAFKVSGREPSYFKGDPVGLWSFFSEQFNGGLGFYRNLEPCFYAHSLIKHIKDLLINKEFNYSKFELEILTAETKLLQIPTIRQEKIDWVHEHFGTDIPVNFGPLSENKQDWANRLSILIDDRELNIKQWRDRDGFGLVYSESKFDNIVNELKDLSTALRYIPFSGYKVLHDMSRVFNETADELAAMAKNNFKGLSNKDNFCTKDINQGAK